METPWAQEESLVTSNFRVDALNGLSTDEVEIRLQKFGRNIIQEKSLVAWPKVLLRQLSNPIVFVLGISTGVAILLGEQLEAAAIFSILIINVIIGFIQEFKAEHSLEALARVASPKGRVLREGRVVEVRAEDIVPGDVLVFEAGDYVLGDARIIESHQLSLDESILTGESLPVAKNTQRVEADTPLADRTDMIFAGTAVSSGSGKAIVTSTGASTEVGKIASLLRSPAQGTTPLQSKLGGMSNRLILLGVMIILATFVVGYFRGESFAAIIFPALSLAIAAIPEGLPTVVTLALVLAVKRMAKKNALVRKLDAVETLGATDIICTDKTGTLTFGKMLVRDSFLLDPSLQSLLVENMVLCNNASIQEEESGDTTEIALLRHVLISNNDPESIRRKFPRFFIWNFDSTRKRMSVAVDTEKGSRIYTKGAPESIISICKLKAEEQDLITSTVTRMSSEGMRVLAFAYKEESDRDLTKLEISEVESGLNFLGLIAMADPPRKDTLKSIVKCQDAGIRIIMVTGDHPLTARAIAGELGILTGSHSGVITGKEVDELSDLELLERVETMAVFARVSPEHKLRLVRALREKGHIVAMTGDGVNDAPALKFASIGVAMGKGGTEVARQASSMVLVDDNFSTIVDAVEEGRAIHGNIRRTLQYLLSHNLAELVFIFGCFTLGWPVPLLPLNLLWLNLVTDGFPALGLASEKVPNDYLAHSRKPTLTTFLDSDFYKEMLFIAVVITVMYFALYRQMLLQQDLLSARSFTFTFMVYVGLFRSLSCRSDEKTYFEMPMNWPLLISVLVPLVLQLMIQNVQFFQNMFQIRSLSASENIILMVLSPIPVTLIELQKLWRRRKRKCLKLSLT